MTQIASAKAAQRQRNFVRAFIESVFGTGLSKVLGLARDATLTAVLGAGAAHDAYQMANSIPGTFRRFVADEGLTGALIPALSRTEAEEGRPRARQLANAVFTVLLLVNLLVCTLGIVFAEPLVLAFAWSWHDDPEKFDLAVRLTRLLFPFVIMLSIVSYFEALLNFRGHFFVPKLAPGIVSAGVVAGALLLSTHIDPVYAAATGLLFGAVAHVLVHLPLVWSRWGPFGLSTHLRDPRLYAVLGELGKVVVIGIVAPFNILVLRQLASSGPTGSVTWYVMANQVANLSWGLVAVAIGSALLPNLSHSISEHDWDRFRDDLVQGLRLAAFVMLPMAVVLAVFAMPIVTVLFYRGRFTWADVEMTALTVQLLVPYVLAIGGINIVKRVYFALDDRWTLIAVGALGVLLTGGVGLLLMPPLGVAGLGLALSAATAAQFVAYVLLLRRRLGTRLGLDRIWGPLGRMLLASLPVIGVLWAALQLGDWTQGTRSLVNGAVFLGGLGASAALYLVVARLLRLREVDALFGRLMARVRRR